MPILVALVEAMADPRYGVEHSGNTPGAETLIILNGPIIKELGFNYEQGALRDGIQANTTIGRFWRLYLRNVAGFLHHRTDKGTFGNTWRVVLAENEDALRRIGWTTIAEDEGVRGRQRGHDLALHRRRRHRLGVRQRAGADAALPGRRHRAARSAGSCSSRWAWAAGSQRPLLILSPILAETLARGGLDKPALKQRLFELRPHARRRSSRSTSASGPTSCRAGRRSTAGAAGQIPPVFAESEDPDRLVPIVCRAEDIMVAVSGDPLRTNAYAFAHNGILGYPDDEARSVCPRSWPTPAPRGARPLSARVPRGLALGAAARGPARLGRVDRRHAAARAEEKGLLARTPLAGEFPRQRVELIRGADRVAEVESRCTCARGWTDGLPIVPPTARRAWSETLALSPLERHDVLGRGGAARGRRHRREGRGQRGDGGLPAGILPGGAGRGAGAPRPRLQPARRADHRRERGAAADRERPGGPRGSASTRAGARSARAGRPTPPSAARCAS